MFLAREVVEEALEWLKEVEPNVKKLSNEHKNIMKLYLNKEK